MPNWESFQNQHVLDPTVDPGWNSWNKEEWNEWLRRRISNFGTKQINSVVVGTPENIKRAFEHPAHGWSQKDFWWSEETFELVFMKLVNNRNPPYDIQKLGQMYFLALIDPDPNRPVHFHGQTLDRPSSGQLPKSFPNPKVG